MYYREIREMSSLTSMQIQALLRDMDGSMRKHRALKTSDPTKYFETVAEDNKLLCEVFPGVFKMHIEGRLDATFFEMLKLKLRMEKGELTEDEASRIVGQKLFDTYVAPVVNSQPAPEKPMSYSDFYKQYDNKDA
jgi:hypothetical protein